MFPRKETSSTVNRFPKSTTNAACMKKNFLKTHLILPTSFPTLLAYAPWSLDSFVVRLILKYTSSPDAETT